MAGVIPPDEVIAAFLAPTTRHTRRVEIYESDGITRWSKDKVKRLKGGNVTVDYSRTERRALDLQLSNDDGVLITEAGEFWYDKIIKVFRGVILNNDTTWETQIGEFMIDRIVERHFPHEVSITGRDYTKKLLKSKFTRATQFPTGMALESIISSIASNGGITKRNLPPTGIVVNKTFFFERGTERWTAIKEIASSYNYDVFFDSYGYLTIEPQVDPATTPPVLTVNTGSAGNMVSWEKSTSDARLYNHVLVTSETSDASTLPMYAEALNEDPNSETSIAKIGDRLYQYTSGFFTEQSQLDDVAAKFLAIHSLEEFELTFESLMLPWLDVGVITEFNDGVGGDGDPTRFLLSTLGLPLNLAPMSGNGKRVVIVG